MAYRKRKESSKVTNAKKRLQLMDEIDVGKGGMVEYGDSSNPVNSSLLKAKIAKYEKVISALNQFLGKADEKLNEEKELSDEIGDLCTRTLQGAKAKFGLNSSEVEKLGGKRKSERKKPDRKKKTE